MIKKIQLSKWVFYLTLLMVLICILSLSPYFLNYNSDQVSITFWLVMYFGIFGVPIMLILLLIDRVFNRDSNLKLQVVSFFMNAFVFFLAYYYGSHLFDNLMSLG